MTEQTKNIERSKRRKTSFLNGWVENADLRKPTLKKIMTKEKLCVAYNSVSPLKKLLRVVTE